MSTQADGIPASPRVLVGIVIHTLTLFVIHEYQLARWEHEKKIFTKITFLALKG